jgi:hypothetical protein
MTAIAGIVGLLSFGCLVFVLTKMYPKEGVGKTILGFICAIYAFIWGWQNIKNEDAMFKNVMYAWTGIVLLNIILSAIIQAQAGG